MKSFIIYEIQLEGIKCTACVRKITEKLKEREEIIHLNINILSEKLFLTIADSFDISILIDDINNLNFKVLKTTKIHNTNQYERTLYFSFFVNFLEKNELLEYINKSEGIIHAEYFDNQLIVIYNELITNGRNIYDALIKKYDVSNFKVFNPILDNLKPQPMISKISKSNFFLSVLVLLVYLSYWMNSLMFPEFFFYPHDITYPISYCCVLYIIFSVLILILLGKQILISATKSLKNGIKLTNLNMESLISLGILSSFMLATFLLIRNCFEAGNKNSSHEVSHQREMQIEMIIEMFLSSSMILSIITIGKKIEEHGKNKITNRINSIFPTEKLLKTKVLTFFEPKNKKCLALSTHSYPIELFSKNDLIQINEPCTLLLDCSILKVDQNNELKVIDSVYKGSDEIKIVKEGERIMSGAEIKSGSAILRVENNLEKSFLIKILQEAILAQSRTQDQNTFISKIAAYFVSFIIFLAILVNIVWNLLLATQFVVLENQFCVWCFPIERMIAVLVASCPCALGLAIPSVMVSGMNIGLRHGIIFKSLEIIKKINEVTTIVFDKTGTLFTNVKNISDCQYYNKDNKFSNKELWKIISLVESNFSTPLATFLYKQSIANNEGELITRYKIYEKPEFKKTGIVSKIIDVAQTENEEDKIHDISIGNIFLNPNIAIPKNVEYEIEKKEKMGQTGIIMAIDNVLQIIIYIDNQKNLRCEAKEVMNCLKNNFKKKICILSGDSVNTVSYIGDILGFEKENLIGNACAETKRQLLHFMKLNGEKTMMIGDGLNDVPSLSESSVGVSINSKSEINLMAADVILLEENLWKIPIILKLSRTIKIFIRINLIWTFSYNIIILPIVAGCFYRWGVDIPPLVSSLAMSLSSIVVVLMANLMTFLKFNIEKRGKTQKNSDFMGYMEMVV